MLQVRETIWGLPAVRQSQRPLSFPAPRRTAHMCGGCSPAGTWTEGGIMGHSGSSGRQTLSGNASLSCSAPSLSVLELTHAASSRAGPSAGGYFTLRGTPSLPRGGVPEAAARSLTHSQG